MLIFGPAEYVAPSFHAAELANTVLYVLSQLAELGNTNAELSNFVFNSGVQSLPDMTLSVMLIFEPAVYSVPPPPAISLTVSSLTLTRMLAVPLAGDFMVNCKFSTSNIFVVKVTKCLALDKSISNFFSSNNPQDW